MVIMSSYTNLMFIADIEQHEIQKVVEIDEENIKKAAVQYGYTERRLRQMLNENRG